MQPPLKTFLRYGLALALPALALLLREWVGMYYEIPHAFAAPFTIPVLIAAAVGGLGPGLVATLLGALLCDWFVMMPLGLGMENTADQARLLVTALLGIALSVVTEIMHRTQRRCVTLIDEAKAHAQELKQAHAESRANEERYRALVHATAGVVWRTPADGGDAMVLTQSTPGAENATAEPVGDWISQVHPEDRARTLSAWNRALSGKTLYEIEHRSAGELRHFLTRAAPIFNSRGDVTEWVGASTDITEKKRAQDALRESERMLSLIYDNSRDAIFLARVDADEQYSFISVNRTFLSLSGHTPDQVLQQELEKIIPEHELPKLRANFRRAIKLRRPVWYEDAGDPAAGARCSQTTLVPICENDGPVTHILAAVSDVTDQRATERKLRDSEEQFRRALQEAPVPVIMHAEDGEVLQLSRAWTQLTGYTLADLPTFDAWLTKAYGYGADEVRAQVRALFKGETELISTEFEVFTRAGEPRTWAFSASCPGSLQDGRRFIVGMALDITERKHTEQALKESDQRKDEFLATLSHELRNPLAPLRNALVMLRMNEGGNSDALRLHQMMERQLNFLVRLVDDLFEVSRISRGKVELQLQPVALDSVLRSALETSQPLIHAARHQLKTEIAETPLWVQADAVRLVQVFANLLNNAARYTPDGGLIRLTLRRDGNEAVISLRDNGAGIPSAMLPRIFDMFTQVERSVQTQRGGLGLGLALVRGLVKMHGGSVQAFSSGAGEGSEFVVRLPLIEPPGDCVPAALPAAAPQLRRILIVDDNHDAADSLSELLQLTGNITRAEYTGAEALAALDSFRPDVILLDIGMPLMDGYEVARHIRKHAQFSHVRLIALSGWAQHADRQRSHAAGFDHHLSKPVEFSALQELLNARI